MKVTMLGRAGDLKWSQSGGNVMVQMPAAPGDAREAQHAYAIKLSGVQ